MSTSAGEWRELTAIRRRLWGGGFGCRVFRLHPDGQIRTAHFAHHADRALVGIGDGRLTSGIGNKHMAGAKGHTNAASLAPGFVDM